MRLEGRFDLARVDIVATGLEHLFDTTDKSIAPVRALYREISGTKKSVRAECLRGRQRRAPVFQKIVTRSRPDPPHFPGDGVVPSGGHEPNFNARKCAANGVGKQFGVARRLKRS